jgi:hypothetical protein
MLAACASSAIIDSDAQHAWMHVGARSGQSLNMLCGVLPVMRRFAMYVYWSLGVQSGTDVGHVRLRHRRVAVFVQRTVCTRTGLPASCDISAASETDMWTGPGLYVLEPSKWTTRKLLAFSPVTSAAVLRKPQPS